MRKSVTSRKSRTDWKRVRTLKDDKIDFSDTPELTQEIFARRVVRRRLKLVPRKVRLTELRNQTLRKSGGSPLDVPGVDAGISRDETVDLVRESRRSTERFQKAKRSPDVQIQATRGFRRRPNRSR